VQPAEHRAVSSDEILAAWRKATGTIDDAVAVVYSPLARGPAEKPLDVRLLGDNLDQLRQAADDVADQLRQFAGVSGVEHDLQPGKREIRVTLRPLARTLGITLDDLATELRSGFYGGEAVRVQRGRDDVRVQVRYPRNERQSVADIESVRIRGAAGNEVPFHEIADYKVERGYAAIRHEEGRRRVQITANLDERLANAERILGELETGVISKLPQKYPGIEYRLEGQRAQMRESMRSLFRGFALALVVIYALLAAILRSYVQPVVIMAAIPLGLVGAVVGHWLLGYDLTMLSLFGMVGISGVVVNDSLVLLDRINENTRSGRTVLESTLEAGGARFRAVLLTTVTTVMGLAPLMTERSTQAKTLIPMAISLTFGLAFATALTLLVVPALHLALNDMRRLARWLRRGGEYPSPEAIESLSTSHDAT
jgi:multidrug efflux pump subunit AcrB